MLELYAWGPGYDVPSFDPFCLAIQTYMNLLEIKWTFNECSTPGISPSNELPVLKIGDQLIAGTDNIIRTLVSRGHDLDDGLTAFEKAESQAFVTMIEEKLHNSLLHSWFVEDENYTKQTQLILSSNSSLVYRSTLAQQMKQKAQHRLGFSSKSKINGEYVLDIYLSARECYQALADKLGTSPYFYGDQPTTLDAVAFGHLVLHVYPSLSVPTLFSILSFEFPTLIAFVERMRPLINIPLVILVKEQLSFQDCVLDFYNHPSTYLTQVWNNFNPKNNNDKAKEDRVEKFWRGFTVLGAIAFFGLFVIKQKIVELGELKEDDT